MKKKINTISTVIVVLCSLIVSLIAGISTYFLLPMMLIIGESTAMSIAIGTTSCVASFMYWAFSIHNDKFNTFNAIKGILKDKKIKTQICNDVSENLAKHIFRIEKTNNIINARRSKIDLNTKNNFDNRLDFNV